eukprot:517870_1
MSQSTVCLLIDEVLNDINNWKPKMNAVTTDNTHNKHSEDTQKPPKELKKRKKKMKVYNPPYTAAYFDSHCHLDELLTDTFECKISEFPTIYNEYFNGNFEGALTIACAPDQFKPICDLIYSQHKTSYNIYGSFGIHPQIANEWNDTIKKQIIDLVTNDKQQKRNKIIAIGECGLDYSDERNATKDIQHKAFIEQIMLSVQLNLPLVVHSRQASNDTIDIMRKYCPKNKLIHLHCLTDSLEFAKTMLNDFPNLKIGFTGLILFKKVNELRNVVKNVPLNRILLE